jgi:hypothetical protein
LLGTAAVNTPTVRPLTGTGCRQRVSTNLEPAVPYSHFDLKNSGSGGRATYPTDGPARRAVTDLASLLEG